MQRASINRPLCVRVTGERHILLAPGSLTLYALESFLCTQFTSLHPDSHFFLPISDQNQRLCG